MKKFMPKIKIIICAFLCGCLLLSFSIMTFATKNEKVRLDKSILEIWQVDSFEGGKGSRADYLEQVGKEFAADMCYVNVSALSAEGARLNIQKGNFPDIISYGAGMYGIERYISGYTTWCRGSYCLLTISGDFSDIDIDNTIINKGKDNLISIASLFLGLQGAVEESPTGAYTKLLNGKYKYLLGTQRDIYRLKTRQAVFKVKGINEFNDLYQNVSIINASSKKELSQNFINFLLSKNKNLIKLGLFYDGGTNYDDEMKEIQSLKYKYKLSSPVSEEIKDKLLNCIKNKDINMIKTMLF